MLGKAVHFTNLVDYLQFLSKFDDIKAEFETLEVDYTNKDIKVLNAKSVIIKLCNTVIIFGYNTKQPLLKEGVCIYSEKDYQESTKTVKIIPIPKTHAERVYLLEVIKEVGISTYSNNGLERLTYPTSLKKLRVLG